jgi:putative ABC transport system substrate-binding protein
VFVSYAAPRLGQSLRELDLERKREQIARTEAERHSREAHELRRLSRALTHTDSATAAAQRVADAVMRLFDPSSAVVRLIETDGAMTAVAVAGENPVVRPGHRMPAGSGVVGQAVTQRKLVMTNSVLTDPRIDLPSAVRDQHERLRHQLVIAAPLAAEAQERKSLPRIAVLFVGPRNDDLSSFVRAHEDGLRELGWVRDRDIIIEERFSGTMQRMPAVVNELLHINVRAIVTGANDFIDVARQATTTVPIVMVYGFDPIGNGYAASLAHPGDNITGLSWEAGPEIGGKYVELVASLVPVTRVAGIVDPRYPASAYRRAAELAAKDRGMTLEFIQVRAVDDLKSAFAIIKSHHAAAAIIFEGPFVYLMQPQISALALRNGVPTISLYREGPKVGGLLSYGPNLADSWRRAAFYVGKILSGAKPADLPIQQPTKFELVINLKTAKALGLTIPPSLLLRADQVIACPEKASASNGC